MALKNVRRAVIDAGRARRLIDKDVKRLMQLFGRAVESELRPDRVDQARKRVKGLRMGRSAAREKGSV